MTWLKPTEIECAPSGNPYDYLHPKIENIELDDISLSLSQTCRFGGFTRPFQSVASHCLLVADILAAWGFNQVLQLDGLFHDAHEAYLVDAPRPLKMSGVPEFDRLAAIADVAIADRFGLNWKGFHEPIVKKADLVALFHEGALLMPTGPAGWNSMTTDGEPVEDYEPLPDGVDVRLEPMELSRGNFYHRADNLLRATVPSYGG